MREYEPLVQQWEPFSAIELETLRRTHLFLVKAHVSLSTTMADLRYANRPGAIVRVRNLDDIRVLPFNSLWIPPWLTDPTWLTIILQETCDMAMRPDGEPYPEVSELG